MLLQEFPDLAWLKQQINQRFQQQRAFNNLPLETGGFPSVIIHTKVSTAYRPDITGPISLFLNHSGTGYITTDNRKVTVPEDFYFISNRFQPYTLEIESKQPVETFNIHIGEHFSEGVLSALLTPADKILNNGLQQPVHTVAFHNKLYRRDAHFNALVNALQLTTRESVFDKLLFEERLEKLLLYLLMRHRDILRQVEKLPAVKQSTRLEVYKRLGYAIDLAHANLHQTVSLEEMAAAAYLSKYHFLRLFKWCMGMSPYQYIQELRMQKARDLLKKTALPVHEIAASLGFENSPSFSRLFYQRMGIYPAQYRQ